MGAWFVPGCAGTNVKLLVSVLRRLLWGEVVMLGMAQTGTLPLKIFLKSPVMKFFLRSSSRGDGRYESIARLNDVDSETLPRTMKKSLK